MSRMMTKPTNSENPGLFWFYRLVGFGAIFAAVRLNRNGSGWLGAIVSRFKTLPEGQVLDVGEPPEGGVSCARCGTWLSRFGIQIKPDNGSPAYWLGPDCAGSLRVQFMTSGQRARLKGQHLKAYGKGEKAFYDPIYRDEVLPLLTEEQKYNIDIASSGISRIGIKTAIWGKNFPVSAPYLPQLQTKYPIAFFRSRP